MRLKSEIWVKAYLRRCASHGVNAVVVRHGDDDAGAIYIKINMLDGRTMLFGPAPTGLPDADIGRQFSHLFKGKTVSEAEADAYLAKEKSFDGDCWIVEVEDRSGRHFLADETIS